LARPSRAPRKAIKKAKAAARAVRERRLEQHRALQPVPRRAGGVREVQPEFKGSGTKLAL